MDERLTHAFDGRLGQASPLIRLRLFVAASGRALLDGDPPVYLGR